MNGIGQGSFAAALASSIFQDNISKINLTIEEGKKGATDIGRMMDSKQLRANVRKTKHVNMEDSKSMTSCLEEAKVRPIMMGDHKEHLRE